MLEQLQQNLEQATRQECAKAVTIIASDVAEDIQNIILNGEQFTTSSPEIGAPLVGVLEFRDFEHPLFGRTTRGEIKRRLGAGYPNLPRFNTGALVNSIKAHMVATDHAHVVTSEPRKAETQHFGGGDWVDEFGYPAPYTASRPFFGVSDRALAKAEKEVEATGQRILAAVEKMPLKPIAITI